jgi:hypothetical protein
MRFSEFDFDVITSPADPPKPPPKRGETDPVPEQRRGEHEPTEPPDSKTSRR